MDAEFARNVMEQTHKLWIAPELQRRWGAAGPPGDFRIHRCLIRLPIGKPPIIEFNQEVRWVARIGVTDDGKTLSDGEDVYLHQISEVKTVLPPEVDGKRVAFLFLYRSGTTYSLVFDFSPNSDDGVGPADPAEWELGRHVAAYLQSVLVERAVNVPQSVAEQLREIGLWPAPALLPYPLSAINKLLADGDPAAARNLLVRHCTGEFLEQLVLRWAGVPAFETRKELFDDALAAHRQGKYDLSIYALMPQVEGVVTDWLYANVPGTDVPFRQDSKTKKFRDLVAGKTKPTFADKRVAEVALEFVLSGPVLQTFKDWSAAIDTAFPGRHALGHGKYDRSLMTAENSIKLFLLIDTVWSLIENAR
jgi:hypothetical protein